MACCVGEIMGSLSKPPLVGQWLPMACFGAKLGNDAWMVFAFTFFHQKTRDVEWYMWQRGGRTCEIVYDRFALLLDSRGKGMVEVLETQMTYTASANKRCIQPNQITAQPPAKVSSSY